MSGQLQVADFTVVLAEARDQSTEALGRLWQHCRAYLAIVARAHLPTHLRGKLCPADMVQETFLEAQRDFERFTGGSEAALLAWLKRILLNNLANVSRHYVRTQKRSLSREVAMLNGSDGSIFLSDVASDSETPSGVAVARERTVQLELALDDLPAEYRAVIRYRYEEDLTFDEIGALLQRSAEAARKLSRRALNRLQTSMSKRV